MHRSNYLNTCLSLDPRFNHLTRPQHRRGVVRLETFSGHFDNEDESTRRLTSSFRDSEKLSII